MGFLMFWSLGCTAGALLTPTGAGWLGAALLPLSLRAPRRQARLLSLGCSLLLGATWGEHRAPPHQPLVSPEGRILVEGSVTASQRVSEDRVRVALKDVVLAGVPLERPLFLRADGACAWPAGTRFEGVVDLRSREPAGPITTLYGTVITGAPHIQKCRPSSRVHGHISALSAETSGLLRALSLGDRSGVSASVRETFVDTGTMHLLAISGLHLGVIAWGLYRAALWCLCLLGPRVWISNLPRLAMVVAMIGLVFVVSQIEATDATRRAAWGIGFVALGFLLGRRVDGLRVLTLAATGVVTFDPLAPLGASFQLSFLAVWAILQIGPWLTRVRDHLDEPGAVASARLLLWGRRLSDLALVNLAASLVTAPLGLAWFGQLSLLGPVVNLVATPWVALVVIPLMAAWVMISSASPELGQQTSFVLDWTLGALLDFLEIWAEIAGSAQTAAWPLWAGLCVSLGVIGILGARPARVLGLVLLCLGLCGARAATAPPAAWQVTAIHVGHGDALLIEGPRGEAALIDAGGHPRRRERGAAVARRRLLPTLARLGVHQLDLMVITHGDLDHVGGAAEVARRIPVRELWVSSCPQRAAVTALARGIMAHGGEVLRVSSGLDVPWGSARLGVLWPLEDEPCSAGENDRSVVLSLHVPGGRALLMGDASKRVEERLMEHGDRRLKSDVLKVGHHGSETSTSEELLEATGVRVAIISAPGRHRAPWPAQGVLDRLRRARVLTRVTGRDGSTRVIFEPDRPPRLQTLRTP